MPIPLTPELASFITETRARLAAEAELAAFYRANRFYDPYLDRDYEKIGTYNATDWGE